MNKRPIPQAALDDPNAVEMLSVWIAQRALHCSLKIGMHDEMGISEAKAWGKILADAARHVSKAYAQSAGGDADDVLSRIRSSFDDELNDPTTPISGGFVKKN